LGAGEKLLAFIIIHFVEFFYLKLLWLKHIAL